MKHLSHSLVSIADVNPSLQIQTLSETWKRGDDSDVVAGVILMVLLHLQVRLALTYMDSQNEHHRITDCFQR